MQKELSPKKVMILGIPVVKIDTGTQRQSLSHLTYGFKNPQGGYEFAMTGHAPSSSTVLPGAICKTANTYVVLTTIIDINNSRRSLCASPISEGNQVYGEVKYYGKLGEYGSVINIVGLPAHEAEIADPITGSAQILTTLKGDVPSFYDINITKVDMVEGVGKYFFFDFQDSRLNALLGDSTKSGMSGSPIIQSGKFVGVFGHSVDSHHIKAAFSAKDMLNEHMAGMYAYQGDNLRDSRERRF